MFIKLVVMTTVLVVDKIFEIAIFIQLQYAVVELYESQHLHPKIITKTSTHN